MTGWIGRRTDMSNDTPRNTSCRVHCGHSRRTLRYDNKSKLAFHYRSRIYTESPSKPKDDGMALRRRMVTEFSSLFRFRYLATPTH